MRPGDRVLFVRNLPIDLDRDIGTILEQNMEEGVKVVFDDTEEHWCEREDLVKVVGERARP